MHDPLPSDSGLGSRRSSRMHNLYRPWRLPQTRPKRPRNADIALWRQIVAEGRVDEACDAIVKEHHEKYGVPQRLLSCLMNYQKPPEHTTGPLTERQLDVLHCAARGKTAKQTAEILHLNFETVRTHTQHARKILKARTTTQAVATAIRTGAIRPPSARQSIALD